MVRFCCTHCNVLTKMSAVMTNYMEFIQINFFFNKNNFKKKGKKGKNLNVVMCVKCLEKTISRD